MRALLVAIGASFGAPLRFWLDNKFRPKYKFPIGIFIANILGSFVIGYFFNSNKDLFALIAIGFCGALTTWSTFVLDIYFGFKNKHYLSTLLNFGLSLFLGYLAVKAGMQLYLQIG